MRHSFALSLTLYRRSKATLAYNENDLNPTLRLLSPQRRNTDSVSMPFREVLVLNALSLTSGDFEQLWQFGSVQLH